ncbi:spirocyclase AveC family protein [Streptomyces sp. cg40]|uniref:spirocyclase AveC family protein n=1 Tax=Streptomyces sp. cg40 TaxID=3419764 RepID=UPI003CFFBDC7
MATTLEHSADKQMDAEARKGVPAKWWALVGVAVLSLIAYEWGSWLINGDARPVPAGPSKVPTWMVVSIHSLEAISVLLVGVALYFYAYKPWKRTRKIGTDALMIVAWLFTYMLLDPWENFTAITYSYNAEFVNLGCPQCHVPFWNSPNPNNMGEPLLFIGGMYPGMLFLGTVFSCWAMRKVKARYPRTGTFALIMVAFASMFVWDFALEVPPMLAGAWMWWWGGGNFTLFNGQYFQQPLLEPLTWGFCWGIMGCLRYFVNDRGETLAERGIDRIKVSDRKKTFIRLLSLTGAISTIMAVGYMLPYQFFGTHAAATPSSICSKSYFTTGLAGPGTTLGCPNPQEPLPMNGKSARIGPDGKLYVPGTATLPTNPPSDR